MNISNQIYSNGLIYLVLILVSYSPDLLGKEAVYVREYSYDASELESKATARQNAIRLMKAELLEEVRSFIVSESELKRSQKNQDFQSSFESHVKSVSAGSIRSEILEESWDGDRFWVKARLFLDEKKIERNLQQVLKNGAPDTGSKPGIRQTAPATPAVDQVIYAPQMPAPNYSEYVQNAKLANVLIMMAPVKIRVAEYYQINGVWPTKLEQIGFEAGEMTDGENIKDVQLKENGEVRANLMPVYGTRKYISLKSSLVMGGSVIKWTCTTNLDKKLFKMPAAVSCKAR